MQVTLELPEDLARLFGEHPAGLNRAALEALTVEGLRSGRLTASHAAVFLGFRRGTRWTAFSRPKVCSYLFQRMMSRETLK